MPPLLFNDQSQSHKEDVSVVTRRQGQGRHFRGGRNYSDNDLSQDFIKLDDRLMVLE